MAYVPNGMLKLNYLDLFSGIGGFHLGLTQAGFQFTKQYHSEIDKYAEKIYSKRFPKSKALGSIESIPDIEKPDIVTFGSPCQDFSLAGKRAGLDGQRSNLIRPAISLIERYKPNVFIWENVEGTFSSNAGADFWAIIKTFANIGVYRLQWQLLNTAWILPQNRKRIYLVGTLGERSKPEIFPIREDDFLDRPTRKEKTEKVPCLEQTGFKGVSSERFYGLLQRPHGYNQNMNPKSLTLRGSSQQHNIFLRFGHGIRRFTPVEYERLQGFPDGWTEGISDSQRYRLLGNAVSIPIVKLVGEKILNFLQNES